MGAEATSGSIRQPTQRQPVLGLISATLEQETFSASSFSRLAFISRALTQERQNRTRGRSALISKLRENVRD